MSQNSITRCFLGWQGAALAKAAERLIEQYRTAAIVDLGNVVTALTGGRAGRRFLEILLDATEARQLALVPPRIVTIGQLPELFYEAQKPFADHLTQQLAWIEALQRTNRDQLTKVIREIPDQRDLFQWLALGEMLSQLHRELAADALDFTYVAQHGEHLESFDEVNRWGILAEIQAAYLRTLDELDLWDLQTARLHAIQFRECQTENDIVLIGTVDMNRTQRQMLDQVAGHVTAFIFAPQDREDSFDEHGCLIPEDWQDAELGIQRSQISVVEGAGDQADEVIRRLAAWNGQFAADEITIGVADESLVPFLQQRLAESELPARYGVGVPLLRSGPCQLLDSAARLLDGGGFRQFAAFVRHPMISEWLDEQGCPSGWLTALDRFQGEHLPGPLSSDWQKSLPKEAEATSDSESSAAVQIATSPVDTERVADVDADFLADLSDLADLVAESEAEESEDVKPEDALRMLFSLVDDLLGECKGSPRPLAEWGETFVELLIATYGRRALDRETDFDRAIITACDKIHAVLREQQLLPTRLAPCVTAAEAIRLTLRELESEAIPPRPNDAAIELLGWLELPLDDAPALIVTGMNEGIVPASRNSDLFLPNELRKHLCLEDNDRRQARDVYALSLLAASRPDLCLIAGRRNAEGEPMVPSRLLFACDAYEMAERTKAFFKAAPKQRKIVLPGSLRPGKDQAEFPIPRPLPLGKRVDSMRVTEFRDYLACKYRYYLRHRLKLQSLSDSAEELDGGMFGSLMHEVLNRFGLDAIASSPHEKQVEQFLQDTLTTVATEAFGENPQPAVRLQVEQMRFRLRGFARWQSNWTQKGWEIRHVEKGFGSRAASLIVDGEPMYLRGRIDRIDYHPRFREWYVFDYKTGDSGTPPDKTHRRKEDWVDLQLPLYRHLVASLGIDTPVRLGYIVLPKDAEHVGELPAAWTPRELLDADEKAAYVVRQIRNEDFWPPKDPPPAFSEEFASICRDGQYAALVEQIDDTALDSTDEENQDSGEEEEE